MIDTIVGSGKDGDYIALVSTQEEIELIQQLIKDENKEFLIRDRFPIKNLVGLGDPNDTTDEIIRRYIRFRIREGDKLYACHCPVTHYTVNHYNAISSWKCVLEALKYPKYLILVVMPRVIDKTQSEVADIVAHSKIG